MTESKSKIKVKIDQELLDKIDKLIYEHDLTITEGVVTLLMLAARPIHESGEKADFMEAASQVFDMVEEEGNEVPEEPLPRKPKVLN